MKGRGHRSRWAADEIHWDFSALQKTKLCRSSRNSLHRACYEISKESSKLHLKDNYVYHLLRDCRLLLSFLSHSRQHCTCWQRGRTPRSPSRVSPRPGALLHSSLALPLGSATPTSKLFEDFLQEPAPLRLLCTSSSITDYLRDDSTRTNEGFYGWRPSDILGNPLEDDNTLHCLHEPSQGTQELIL